MSSHLKQAIEAAPDIIWSCPKCNQTYRSIEFYKRDTCYNCHYGIMKEAEKFDDNKPPWALLPYDALAGVVDVLSHGAKKYEPRNWEKGIDYDRLFSALQRHLTVWWQGEDRDPETNLSHLAHAGCCLLFLLAEERRGMTQHDNRPKNENQLKEKKETDQQATTKTDRS